MYLSSVQAKSEKLLHSSYLKAVNFRGDKFSCGLVFTDANFVIFRAYLFWWKDKTNIAELPETCKILEN